MESRPVGSEKPSPFDVPAPLGRIRFAIPDVAGKKVLVLGLGGGSDVVTAYVVSTLFDGGGTRELVYANTKTTNVGPVTPITPHLVRVASPPPTPGAEPRRYGRGTIDHNVPRNAAGSPWIILLDDDADRVLVGELQSLAFDLVLGVDTGADSFARKYRSGRLGRDQRMLRILQRTGLPLLHVVVAPGCDGECSFAEIAEAFQKQLADKRYRGFFSLEPLLPVFRSVSGQLGPTRTPRLILAAADGQLKQTENGRLIVPRGKEPAVPPWWMLNGFVFEPGEVATD